MSTEQVTRCDVFRTLKDVRKYRVLVCEVEENDLDGDTIEPVHEADLSPRALARLIKKIESGTTPPAKRKEE